MLFTLIGKIVKFTDKEGLLTKYRISKPFRTIVALAQAADQG